MVKGNNNGRNSKELYNTREIKIKIKIAMKKSKLCIKLYIRSFTCCCRHELIKRL